MRLKQESGLGTGSFELASTFRALQKGHYSDTTSLEVIQGAFLYPNTSFSLPTYVFMFLCVRDRVQIDHRGGSIPAI